MNQYEYASLSDTTLPHEAVVLYIRWFRKRMDYKTGLVQISLPRMMDALEYNPAHQSRDKHTTVSLQRIRTLISHLERCELVRKVASGDIKKHTPAVYLCTQASTDNSKSTATRENPATTRPTEETPTAHQHDSNTYTPTRQQHAAKPINKGIQGDSENSQQHVEKSSQQHYTDISDIKDKDLVGVKNETDKKPAKKTTKRFKPPTLEQAAEHAIDKGADHATAEQFFYYYESNGWMVGKSKMKNWKAALSLWINRNKTNQQKGQNYAKPKQTGFGNLLEFSKRNSGTC